MDSLKLTSEYFGFSKPGILNTDPLKNRSSSFIIVNRTTRYLMNSLIFKRTNRYILRRVNKNCPLTARQCLFACVMTIYLLTAVDSSYCI